MNVKPINKTIDISAPREKVWDTLFSDASYREWTSVFSAGSKFDTDWQVGSKVGFTDESGTGMLGHITENIPNEKLVIEYDGLLAAGQEDTESPDALVYKGATETYVLSEKDGGTHLEVFAGMADEYYDFMNEAWDKAMEKIKEISER